MELRVVLRGALAGLVSGAAGFLFAWIFAEPQIDKAIRYESGRDGVIAQLQRAAGKPVDADGPEIFSRHLQSTAGLATGIVAFAIAMGALVAVAYLVMHGRIATRPRALAAMIAAYGFLGVYLLPFVKYPANPPAIGHSFTITTRGHLYLTMVVCSLLFLGLAVLLARMLRPRFGTFNATLLAAAAFLVVYSVLIGLLPSLGDLAANVAHSHDIGFGRSSTETPLPITDASGRIVYPGFPADVLWKFRWYSLIEQLIVWGGVALAFGALLERYLYPARRGSGPLGAETPAGT